MAERDTKEVLKDSMHNVASMGDLVADNVKVEYDDVDIDTLSEVVENSNNIEYYKNVMPHVYEVLPEGTMGELMEKGVTLNVDEDNDVVEFKFQSFDGLNVDNVVDLAMEISDVVEVN